jgi:GH24 family phage-related lysozyme (muramidase)
MTNAISAHGLALIQAHEGFRAEPAQLPDGNWVVGFSHVRLGDPGAPIDHAEAVALLVLDVAPFENLVNARVSSDLNQSQFDALVSFAFSIGAEAFEQSQVLRRVNTGDHMAAACAMDAWRKSDVGGELEIVDALVRRRAAEKEMFLRDLVLEAPSAFVRAKLDHAASILGAPLKYAAAPAVGTIPVAQPKPAPATIITEILKSEPATETLLLTQVVPADVVEEEGEIVTAHARPVARSLDEARAAVRRAQDEMLAAQAEKNSFQLFKPKHTIPAGAAPAQVDRRLRKMRQRAERRWLPRVNSSGSLENLGLVALLVFGVALLAVSGSLALNANGGLFELGAAAGVGVPGVVAVLMSVFGFRRGEREDDSQHEAQHANA